jgi:hypothetical protein
MKAIHIQGDVYLIEVDSVPEGLEAKEYDQYTVQHGEATEHHHTLYPTTEGAKLKVYEGNGKRFIEMPTEWLLRHQEHAEFRCKGLYEIKIEERYDPFEKAIKRAVD